MAWIEWLHEGKELELPPVLQEVRYTLMKIFLRCCDICLSLGGCYFEESKMPQQPVHENCHCKKRYIAVPIANVTAKADCPLSKFTGYIFAEKYKEKGKKDMFEKWGYGIIDADNLKEEFEKQAVKKYIEGEYTLHILDGYGQNINIVIDLIRPKDGTMVHIMTGWKVRPYGKITCNTPYTGFIS